MSDPILAYYGDDFTGSTDVMEVLQWSGLRTVLFLQPPTKSQLQSFDNLRAFGIAGWSRSMSPAEMDAELKPALARLKDSNAKVVHYKVCSTFDSSPEIGNIGKAIELGRGVIGTKCVPVVVGAPNLARYQVFGNLFAKSGLDTEAYRLDRHPTMQQHPITPMVEADLRLHLARQTDLKVSLLDILRLRQSSDRCDLADLLTADGLLIDLLDEADLPRVGNVLESIAGNASQTYVVGSSGVEYALSAHWSECGYLDSMRSCEPIQAPVARVEQLLVITGSCSPVNARQIAWAEDHGFQAIPLNPSRLISPETSEQEIRATVGRTLDLVRGGANVILHSSRGPNDSRVPETIAAFESLGFSEQEIRLRSGRTLGPKLGQILKRILAEHRIKRVGIAGGDTSGYIARELGITALEAIAPVAPGSPLCRAYADNDLDGVEFVFKGGQVGKDDVWSTLLKGSDAISKTNM
ncbi:MAG: four-carbon acid sugar kinase family protein [Planctomycetales bacterium]|nr:four-carbon acid sugar kinase family protein [Planctomycetales bacterium]